MSEDEEPTPLRSLPQAHGGVLHPWPKGTSGHPEGRPRKPVNRVKQLFLEKMDTEEEAQAVWGEYIRLCLHARSEELRASMLKDLLDRCGVPRGTERNNATAVAQVVNIIRGAPDLGV